MKKILYITTLSRTINTFLVPHIEMLIDNGNKVDCACCIDKPIDDCLENRGVNVFDIPFTRNPLDVKNLKAFKKLIRIQEENQYDIVHVHTPIASIYGRLLKLKFPKLKTIYTAHGFHFYKGAPKINWIIYYQIEKIMAKFTDIIITINEEDYKAALKLGVQKVYKTRGVGLELDKYNPNLFSKNEVRNELEISKDDFVILMIAEINNNKNHIQMVNAVEVLKKKNVEVKVLCAGEGALLENIKGEIKDRNLDMNIKMLGYRNDIPKLISICDIGMLLSYREGLPRNIMELMAYKKPVIGTNIRGIRDLVRNGVNGKLVDINDYKSTANAIEYMYRNKKVVSKFGHEAYRNIKIYDTRDIICKLKKIYMEI